jgi:AraC family transcriptional regulator
MTREEQLEKEYRSRINRALDFMEQNIDKQFNLEELAQVANFSKFHFHRIFQSITGETPFQLITRLRLEKAASLLVSASPDPITEIAAKSGFSDLSVFSKNFKSYFKVSPSQYRKAKYEKSKIKQTDSNTQPIEDKAYAYFCRSSQTLKWKTNMKLNKSVEVKELPKMTLAYVRHIGSYKGNSQLFEGLWNKLFAWAGPRGLIGGPDFKSLVIYHDDPNITLEDKLRISVCITVNPNTKVDGEVGKMEIEAAQYVVARFELSEQDFPEAWGWVYGCWFPSSGFQPDDKPCFEMYPEEPKDGKFVVDICVPVKPL